MLLLCLAAASARSNPPSELSPRLEVMPVPLRFVRVLNISVHDLPGRAQSLNTEYLKYLDVERLLYQFRAVAGLDPRGKHGDAVPYGGWISNGSLVAGHFTGHFLSALSFTAASTDDAELQSTLAYLIDELAQCQEAYCALHTSRCGYLSAYDYAQIDHLFERQGRTWATLYTLHKIVAGLLDAYTQTNNTRALHIVESFAGWLGPQVEDLIARKGLGWWAAVLGVEFGGMNEAMYNLFSVTGVDAHRRLAERFYKAAFMDPLAASQDSLNGQHANTHLPQVVGVARGWEVTGNATLNFIARKFFEILSMNYTYASGGSNVGEHWRFPGALGTAISVRVDPHNHQAVDSNGFHTEETCTQYNAAKLVRHLFAWTPSATLADDYELKLNNGILGVQHPHAIGRMTYMTPLGMGVSRRHANWNEGWGSADGSFWCCYGTGVESFAKIGDSIYWRQARGPATLWVAQYISSSVQWEDAMVNLTQVVRYASDSSALLVNIDVAASIGARVTPWPTPTLNNGPNGGNGSAPDIGTGFGAESDSPSRLATEPATTTLRLRIPGWAIQDATVIEFNGESILGSSQPLPGSFVSLQRAFASGDQIRMSFGMAPRLQRIKDTRAAFRSVFAILYGPLLLAGLTSNVTSALRADPQKLSSWFRVHPGMRFTAQGKDDEPWVLRPLQQLVDDTYTIYFNISLNAQDQTTGGAMPMAITSIDAHSHPVNNLNSRSNTP